MKQNKKWYRNKNKNRNLIISSENFVQKTFKGSPYGVRLHPSISSQNSLPLPYLHCSLYPLKTHILCVENRREDERTVEVLQPKDTRFPEDSTPLKYIHFGAGTRRRVVLPKHVLKMEEPMSFSTSCQSFHPRTLLELRVSTYVLSE